MGRKSKREGIHTHTHTHTHTPDSLYSTVETNTTLQSNYTPIKINLKRTKKPGNMNVFTRPPHTFISRGWKPHYLEVFENNL